MKVYTVWIVETVQRRREFNVQVPDEASSSYAEEKVSALLDDNIESCPDFGGQVRVKTSPTLRVTATLLSDRVTDSDCPFKAV